MLIFIVVGVFTAILYLVLMYLPGQGGFWGHPWLNALRLFTWMIYPWFWSRIYHSWRWARNVGWDLSFADLMFRAQGISIRHLVPRDQAAVLPGFNPEDTDMVNLRRVCRWRW